ncbi:MAG: TolC family protein [Bacteroidia bacterium]|nr:TolC family protein [Bacteroidia bacterium]
MSRWKIVHLLLFVIPVHLAIGQVDIPAQVIPELQPVEDSTGKLVMPYDLAPLDTLIKRARAYSPMIKSQEQVVSSTVLAREIENSKWLDMTSIYGNASYGTGQYVTELTDQGVSGATLAVRQNLFYNTGITMTISPWDLITRGRRMAIMDAGIYKARFEQMMLEDKVAETVIERYQVLLLSIEMQDIALQGFNNQEINAQLAESYFRSGDITFEEYTRALDSRNKAKLDVAIAKNDVKRAYLLLQVVVGDELH